MRDLFRRQSASSCGLLPPCLGELRQHGRTLFLKCLLLAALSASYNTMYLYGMKWFDVAAGAFTLCMTVVVLPVILLSIRRCVPLETWLSVMLVTMGICLALGPSLRGEQLAGLAIMGGDACCALCSSSSWRTGPRHTTR